MMMMIDGANFIFPSVLLLSRVVFFFFLLLSALEEEYRHLTQVEVDEVSRLVGYVAAVVASDDAVPRGVVLLVEFFLYVRGNVLVV